MRIKNLVYFIISYVAGYPVFSRGWALLLDYVFILFWLFLVSYAWRKTKICPAEIMSRIAFLQWPRAFRLMYKQKAARMIGLYFTCAGVVVLKGLILLVKLVHWII
jgi:hypothetical protein